MNSLEVAGRKAAFALLCLLACFIPSALAQTETATIRGSVIDPAGAVVPKATVRLIDVDRGSQTEVATGAAGFYTFATVRPGHYHIEVEKSGFKMVQLTGVTVNVQDILEENFKLSVGFVSESITVEANNAIVNASDAAVSTLIDNRFVENMPLNGRSFSSLLDLTPGVVLSPSNQYEAGQFSVNGQRPDANYFMVDGVSANLGSAAATFAQSGAGQLPAASAFGGTSNLVSLDALEEFRVQTSTFAPEYGRTPGAQVSVVTKSGTNRFHGTAFEYLRNEILDANDWFANNKGVNRAALRQNDFGGVLGGPVIKSKLFFFGSYEGARVRLPRFANTYVPSLATLAAVQSGPHPEVFPLLNAFPKPTPGGKDFGDGTAALTAGYSDPSSLNAYSLRLDYLPFQKVSVFARYDDAPSSIAQRGAGSIQEAYNDILHTKNRFQSLTLGSNQTITPRLTNEFRFNYSRSGGDLFETIDNFQGGVPPSDSLLFPVAGTAKDGEFDFYGDFNPYGLLYSTGKIASDLQHQINVTDNLFRIVGSHQLKFGVDYRRLRPEQRFTPYDLQYIFGDLALVEANQVQEAYVASRSPDTQLVISNWSLFIQDTWNIAQNLTITYGLRWEYNGAPTSPNGTLPFTVLGLNNLATAQLAPPGTPLWHPRKDDFAPRLAVAWHPRSNLVVRAGAGIFYDLGYSDVTDAMSAFPYVQANLLLPTAAQPLSFPLTAEVVAPPPFSTSPPSPYTAVVDPNHVLPRTYEWNVAVEQSFGNADILTLTYLGAGGRKLMRQDLYDAPNPAQFTGEFDYMHNGASSSYNALEAQFRHRFSHGLQSLFSYTWAHAIDDVSSDVYFVNTPPSVSSRERGSSDYDIRHTFAGAVSYDIPGPGSGLSRSILGSWSTDSIIYARSAPPVNVVTGQDPFGTVFLAGAFGIARPNVVPGVPFYLDQPSAPGGRIFNAAAFSVPASGQGDVGRNALRGFGATQWDMTMRRQFRLTERISLQARGDFFNILNHPNFGNPINSLGSVNGTPNPLFGQSTQMLANALGSGGQSGGLNPLYQIGGPRSVQLALKLQF